MKTLEFAIKWGPCKVFKCSVHNPQSFYTLIIVNKKILLMQNGNTFNRVERSHGGVLTVLPNEILGFYGYFPMYLLKAFQSTK